MVAMPGQLFSNTQIPACLWFLSKDKKPGGNGRIDRSGQILFIDARKQAHGRISRTQVEFTDEDLHRIAQTYHRWRGTDFALEPLSPRERGRGEGSGNANSPNRGEGSAYANVPGFCHSASLEEVEKHSFVLTPGRYVGAVAEDDDDEAFEDKMQRLTTQLLEQMEKGAELDLTILTELGKLRYGV
jgi:type I restriction enzyme M protein